jgi:cytochrome c-type biogenesis protein CcmH
MTMLYIVFALLLSATLLLLLWPLRAQGRFVFAVCLFFSIGAFGIYSLTGSPEIVPLLKEREAELAMLKDAIVRNSEAVKTDPNNLAAWAALGEAFTQTGQYTAAVNAFKQAVLLAKGEPSLILAYARAMILADGGKVSHRAKKSLEMVLMQQPENPEARYFLAIRKLQDGNTQQAMKEMKTLYRSLPEGSPLKGMIDRQIGRN